MAEPEKKQAPAGEPLDKAADRLRDSAKWLVASFGAVAVVIFAGLTVADLGELSGDTPGYRLAIAIAGAAASIVGIVGALARTIRLAGASTTSLEDLRRTDGDAALISAKSAAASDPALMTWQGDFGAFLDDYDTAYDEYVQRVEAYSTAYTRRPDRSLVDKATVRLQLMGGISARILRTVSFLRLQQAFTDARRAIVGWIIVTAVGAVAFGWATSGVPDEPTTLSDRPLTGVLQPGDATIKELNRQLPKACQVALGDSVGVIVLAADQEAEELEVVSVPDEACPPVRAQVPAAEVTSD